MTQEQRRIELIGALLRERGERRPVPRQENLQKRMLRALFNVRPPREAGADFLRLQDEYLREELNGRGTVDYREIPVLEGGIRLWQGDITRLKCDAIVNAANSALLGCFCPNHGCIDNAIHTFAGMQLRLCCAKLMEGREEPTGSARITPAYNLPSRYVLHTVGPIVSGALTQRQEEQLASCYRSCLALAEEQGLTSIAFCCISTGEFGFPPRRAAEIAIDTVRSWLTEHAMEVIFNVFKDEDREIYRELLGSC